MKTNRPIVLLLSLLLLSCGKTEYSDIPHAVVRLQLDLTFEDRELNEVLAHKIYTINNININTERAGFGGVVVYHSSYDDPYKGAFRAYDIACPYENKQEVKIELEKFSSIAKCPVCGSTYDLETGIPTSGPSSENMKGKLLRTYKAFRSGNIIHVSN